MRTLTAAGLVAASLLAAPAALAFTVENKDGAGRYGTPKFDLEEQAKQFRRDGSPSNGANSKTLYETPLGDGKLQFGVTQNPGSGFGSPVFGSQLGPGWSGQYYRDEFSRRLAPPSSLEYNTPR